LKQVLHHSPAVKTIAIGLEKPIHEEHLRLSHQPYVSARIYEGGYLYADVHKKQNLDADVENGEVGLVEAQVQYPEKAVVVGVLGPEAKAVTEYGAEMG